MPGDRWQQLANLRALYAYMWAHPGKKLLFMGGELAQEWEWNHDGELDWGALNRPEHAGVQALVRDLNRIYRDEPALYEVDFEPAGFRWLEPNDAAQNIVAFLRVAADGERTLACVANLSPVPREGFRLGLPRGGRWHEALNSDASIYGGTDVGNGGTVEAEDVPWQDQPWSVKLTLPPLGVLWLVPED
jgi:1,4-alpha-glucan branching enzyme